MRKKASSLGLLALVAALFVCGCAKNYLVTTALTEPLSSPAKFRIGAITDQLPTTVEAKNKPSLESVEKFRTYLGEELNSLKPDVEAIQEGDAPYEVTGGIMQYKKGSGFMRFLIGFGAGNGKVLTELKVLKVGSGDVLFAGNFEGVVGSWAESGDAMFRKVAKDFAKQLKKQRADKRGGSPPVP